MKENPSTPSRRGARTFRATCAVLATVAAAQAAASAWTSKSHELAMEEAAKTAEKKAAPGRPKIVDPFSPNYRPDDPHPELRGPAGEAPLEDPGEQLLKAMQPVVTQRAPVPRPKLPAPLDVPIKDEAVLQHLDEALYLKSQGDMTGALQNLRSALQKMPDHPKLLYHTAQIYDTIGNPQKALPFWKTLHKLGNGAGDFFVLARERIANGPQAAHEAEEEKEGKFTIIDLKDEEFQDVTGGQRVRVTAVLKKNTEEEVKDLNNEMMVTPHFFDTVNKNRRKSIARSQVPQPEVECLTAPADWKEDGTETFAFDYWQPDMSPQEIVHYGRCKYYGCALEVFFNKKLQDSSATIADLLQMARELPVPAPEPESSILDSAPAPGGATEAGLFPPQLKP